LEEDEAIFVGVGKPTYRNSTEPQANVFTCVRKPCHRHWWLMPVVLAIQKAEIRKMADQSQL
jgi:hypothetical protein